MKPALIIGSTCADVTIYMDHIPHTQEDVHPISQTMSLGGCAYNVASTMRLHGANHTLISPVGGGIYGDFVAKSLKKLEIPVAVRIPEQENGCCYCLVEKDGERSFLSLHGIEYSFQKIWMEHYQADHYDFVYICGLEIEEPTGLFLVEYLEKHPTLQIFFSPGPRGHLIDPKKMKRLFALSPILHLSRPEAFMLSGTQDYKEAAKVLHSYTNNTIIITLGKEGTYCLEANGDAYLIPAVEVVNTVDAVGAGDAHVGSILSYLIKDHPLKCAIAHANKVAAATLSVQGVTLPDNILTLI